MDYVADAVGISEHIACKHHARWSAANKSAAADAGKRRQARVRASGRTPNELGPVPYFSNGC